MAAESPVLLNALVAFSAANMSAFDPSRKVAALETRSKALKSLSASVNRADGIAEQETNLAACLVLSTLEISLGQCDGWYAHLQGAKDLILSAHSSRSRQAIAGPDMFTVSSEGRWLLRNFVYHDVMGSIVSGHAPLINPRALLEVDSTVDSYVGVALKILILISDVTCLGSDALDALRGYSVERDEPRITTGVGTLYSQACRIEAELSEWQCPAVADRALYSMANAYRHAALLYLYHRVSSLLDSNVSDITQSCRLEQKLRDQVGQTLLYLSEISFNGFTEGSLLFPLFMVGASTSDDEDIDLIRKRLGIIIENRGFRNCAIALQALENIWARSPSDHLNNSGGWAWQDLPQLGCQGLNLS